MHAPRHPGVSLVELLVTIAVIVVLATAALSAASLLRRQSERTRAHQAVAGIVAGLRTYALEDRRHFFPLHSQLYPVPTIATPHPLALQPEPGAPVGVLSQLVDLDVGSGGGDLRDGRLCDPWGRPYAYQLVRPPPAATRTDWNWDTTAGRPRAWNVLGGTPAPYPYVWSTGPDGSPDNATGWIYAAER